MPPTSGSIEVFGRISSILELGAGFNPEFSGIDNIYLNCSILGMSRTEAENKIDDIIRFADIGEFVHQPVKNYSSGMTVRLAFAIAINVEPAILVVDEALSVGDAAFQRKCFARIHEIKEDGATILFVSHDASAVVDLCQRAVLLDSGRQLFCGDPKKTISYYHKLLFAPLEKTASIRKSILADDNSTSVRMVRKIEDEKAKSVSRASFNPHMLPKSTLWYEPAGAIISNPLILTGAGKKVNRLARNEHYFYCYDVAFTENVHNVRFGMLIKTVRGAELGGFGNRVEFEEMAYVEKGACYHVRMKFACVLLPGTYFLNAGVVGMMEGEERYLHRGIDVAMFEVISEKNMAPTGIVDFGIKLLIKPSVFETA
jgi:lipopolysaccharide transport system ATP-binding protein